MFGGKSPGSSVLRSEFWGHLVPVEAFRLIDASINKFSLLLSCLLIGGLSSILDNVLKQLRGLVYRVILRSVGHSSCLLHFLVIQHKWSLRVLVAVN